MTHDLNERHLRSIFAEQARLHRHQARFEAVAMTGLAIAALAVGAVLGWLLRGGL